MWLESRQFAIAYTDMSRAATTTAPNKTGVLVISLLATTMITIAATTKNATPSAKGIGRPYR